MFQYNPEKHHRRSIRLKNYDYSQDGLYFVTLVLQDRKQLFGKIENQIMQLSELGKFTEQCWIEIPQHYPQVELHEFVIMPDHIHGIIEINNKIHRTENNTEINTGAQNIEPRRKNEYQKIISGSIGSN